MDNFDSNTYWEKRYFEDGTSGAGSYGIDAISKSKYINELIDKCNISTINDYGHGDGNQLRYITGFKRYTGYDVSTTARRKCRSMFNNPNYSFIDHPSKFEEADLALSLDVLYHLVDWDVYEDYMKRLFSIGKFVLIYSCDIEQVEPRNAHCRTRVFTPYVKAHFPSFELVDVNNVLHDSIAMYLYKKK